MSTRRKRAVTSAQVVRIHPRAAKRTALAIKIKGKGLPRKGQPFLWKLAAATVTVVVIAAEENNERKDDNPSAVVIEKTAKAVVIHKVSPFGRLFCPLDSRI